MTVATFVDECKLNVRGRRRRRRLRVASGVRGPWPRAGPTAATAATAATSGWSPTATWPRCSPSATIPTGGPPAACTARARTARPPGRRPARSPCPRAPSVHDLDGGELLADLVHHGDRWLAAAGGRGGRGNARFLSQPAPGAVVRRAGRGGRGALAAPRAQADGRRRPRRLPERRQEHAHLPHLGGQAQDRRLPVHHPRAQPRRGAHRRRRRVRGGRHPRADRGGQRGQGPRPPVPAPHRAGPGAVPCCSTWPPSTGTPPGRAGAHPAARARPLPARAARPAPHRRRARRPTSPTRRAARTGACGISAVTGEGVADVVGRLAALVDEARAAEPEPEGFVVHPPGRRGRPRRAGRRATSSGWSAARPSGPSPCPTSPNLEALAYIDHRLKRLGVDKALARAGAQEATSCASASSASSTRRTADRGPRGRRRSARRRSPTSAAQSIEAIVAKLCDEVADVAGRGPPGRGRQLGRHRRRPARARAGGSARPTCRPCRRCRPSARAG